MKLIIDGYNKTLRKKDNQIVVMEKDNEIYIEFLQTKYQI